MTMIATALTRRLTALPRITLGTLLSLIIEGDRRYRDARHVAGLSDAQLRDVGLWNAPVHLVRKRH
jgi:uncharacterized protein YjiS (DUF1127 family)